ncbi:putative transcription factor Ken [Haemaphysalis longicornis]
MRVHTNERPFACGLCGRRFKQKCSLVSHQNSRHSGGPFGCALCGRGFFNHAGLKQHRCMQVEPA